MPSGAVRVTGYLELGVDNEETIKIFESLRLKGLYERVAALESVVRLLLISPDKEMARDIGLAILNSCITATASNSEPAGTSVNRNFL